MMEFLSIMSTAKVFPGMDASWTKEIPISMKRRDPRIWQMAAVSVGRAFAGCASRPQSIIVGTALGALDETKQFLDGVFSDNVGSPKHFIASVHNSMAGRIAQEFVIPGPNLTVCDGANSFASAATLCSLLTKADFPVLVVAVDETIELLDRLSGHLGPLCQKIVSPDRQEGSIAFILDKNVAAGCPKLRTAGVRYIGDDDPDEAFVSQFISKVSSPFGSPQKVLRPSETDGSFLSLPILVHEFLQNKNLGSAVFGSFSPSSHSIAMVEVCA
jgi:hypothetical protein